MGDAIVEYILAACNPATPDSKNAVDLSLVKVDVRPDVDRDLFLSLIKDHKGHHCEVDPFDGKEHSYIELGGWLGDQGAALCFMAIATKLGLVKLLTPEIVAPQLPQELRSMLAGSGFITITKV